MARRFEISIDGKMREFVFDPSPTIRRDSKLTCELSPIPQMGQTSLVPNLTVSALIRVMPPGPFFVDRFKPAAVTSINGFSGWLSVIAPEKENLKRIIDAGHLSYFEINTGLVELWLDGEKIKFSENARAVLKGDFTGAFNSDGNFGLQGNAQHVEVNSQRLSQTRWEKIGWETKLMLFGGLPASFLWAFGLILKLLRDDYQIKVLALSWSLS